MARNKKKRNKPYTGPDAANAMPNVQRYTAVVRSPAGQWWHDNKKRVKIISAITGGVAFVAYMIYELIRLLT